MNDNGQVDMEETGGVLDYGEAIGEGQKTRVNEYAESPEFKEAVSHWHSMEGWRERVALRYDEWAEKTGGEVPGGRDAMITAMAVHEGYEPKNDDEYGVVLDAITRVMSNGRIQGDADGSFFSSMMPSASEAYGRRSEATGRFSRSEAFKYAKDAFGKMVRGRDAREAMADDRMIKEGIGMKPGETWEGMTHERRLEVAKNGAKWLQQWEFGWELSALENFMPEETQVLLGSEPLAVRGLTAKETAEQKAQRMEKRREIESAFISRVRSAFDDVDGQYAFIEATELMNRFPKSWDFVKYVEDAWKRRTPLRPEAYASGVPTLTPVGGDREPLMIRKNELFEELAKWYVNEPDAEVRAGTVAATVKMLSAVDKKFGPRGSAGMKSGSAVIDALADFGAAVERIGSSLTNTYIGIGDMAMQKHEFAKAEEAIGKMLSGEDAEKLSVMDANLKSAFRMMQGASEAEKYSGGGFAEESLSFMAEMYGMGPIFAGGRAAAGGVLWAAGKTAAKVAPKAEVAAKLGKYWMGFSKSSPFAEKAVKKALAQKSEIAKAVAEWEKAEARLVQTETGSMLGEVVPAEMIADMAKAAAEARHTLAALEASGVNPQKALAFADRIADFMAHVPGAIVLVESGSDRRFSDALNNSLLTSERYRIGKDGEAEAFFGELTPEQYEMIESSVGGTHSVFHTLLLAGLLPAARGSAKAVGEGFTKMFSRASELEAMAAEYDFATLAGIMKLATIRTAQSFGRNFAFFGSMGVNDLAADNMRNVWERMQLDSGFKPGTVDYVRGMPEAIGNAAGEAAKISAAEGALFGAFAGGARLTKEGRERAEQIRDSRAAFAAEAMRQAGSTDPAKDLKDLILVMREAKASGRKEYSAVRDEMRSKLGESGTRLVEQLEREARMGTTEKNAEAENAIKMNRSADLTKEGVAALNKIFRMKTKSVEDIDFGGRKAVRVTLDGGTRFIVSNGEPKYKDKDGNFASSWVQEVVAGYENGTMGNLGEAFETAWDALPESSKEIGRKAFDMERQLKEGERLVLPKDLTDALEKAVPFISNKGVFYTAEGAARMGIPGAENIDLMDGLILISGKKREIAPIFGGMEKTKGIIGELLDATGKELMHEYLHMVERLLIEAKMDNATMKKFEDEWAKRGTAGEGENFVDAMLDWYDSEGGANNEEANEANRASKGWIGRMAAAANDFLFGIGQYRDDAALKRFGYEADLNRKISDILKAAKADGVREEKDTPETDAEVNKIVNGVQEELEGGSRKGAVDETGRGADEAQAKPTGGEVVSEAEGAAEKPVEGEKPRGEAADAGLVKADADVKAGIGKDETAVTPEMRSHYALIVEDVNGHDVPVAVAKSEDGSIREGAEVDAEGKAANWEGRRVVMLGDKLEGEAKRMVEGAVGSDGEAKNGGAGFALPSGDFLALGNRGLDSVVKAGLITRKERDDMVRKAQEAFDRARRELYAARAGLDRRRKFISNAEIEKFVNGSGKSLVFDVGDGLRFIAHKTGVGGVNGETGKNTSWGGREDNGIRWEYYGNRPKFTKEHREKLERGEGVKVGDVLNDGVLQAAFPEIFDAPIILEDRWSPDVSTVTVKGVDTKSGEHNGVKVDKLPFENRKVVDRTRTSKSAAGATKDGEIIIFSRKGGASAKEVNDDIAKAVFDMIAAREGWQGRKYTRNSSTGKMAYRGWFTMDDFYEKAGRSGVRYRNGHAIEGIYTLFGDPKLSTVDRESVLMSAAENYVKEFLKETGRKGTRKQIDLGVKAAANAVKLALEDAGGWFARELEAEAYALRTGKDFGAKDMAKYERSLIFGAEEGLAETGAQRSGKDATRRTLGFYKRNVGKAVEDAVRELFGGDEAKAAFAKVFDEAVGRRMVVEKAKACLADTRKFRSVSELKEAIAILDAGTEAEKRLAARLEAAGSDALTWHKDWERAAEHERTKALDAMPQITLEEALKKRGLGEAEAEKKDKEGGGKKRFAAKKFTGDGKSETEIAEEGNTKESDRYLDALEMLKRPMKSKLLVASAADVVRMALEREGLAGIAKGSEAYRALEEALKTSDKLLNYNRTTGKPWDVQTLIREALVEGGIDIASFARGGGDFSVGSKNGIMRGDEDKRDIKISPYHGFMEAPRGEIPSWLLRENRSNNEGVKDLFDAWAEKARQERAFDNDIKDALSKNGETSSIPFARRDVKAGTIKTLFETWNRQDVQSGEGNISSSLSDLFDLVFPVAEKLGVKFRFGFESGEPENGGYWENGVITYNLNRLDEVTPAKRAQTICHELIHGISTYALSTEEADREGIHFAKTKLTPALKQLASEVLDIFKREMRSLKRTKQYGATDAHEMLAEVSNPEFVDAVVSTGKNGQLTAERIASIITDFCKNYDVDVHKSALRDFNRGTFKFVGEPNWVSGGDYSVSGSRTPSARDLYRAKYGLPRERYDRMTLGEAKTDSRESRMRIAAREATRMKQARIRNAVGVSLAEVDAAVGMDTAGELLWMGTGEGSTRTPEELAEALYEGFVVNARKRDGRARGMTMAEIDADPVLAADFGATVASFLEHAGRRLAFGRAREDAMDAANALRHRLRPSFESARKIASGAIASLADAVQRVKTADVVAKIEKLIDREAMGRRPVKIEMQAFERDVAPRIQQYWKEVKKAMHMTEKSVNEEMERLRKELGEDDWLHATGGKGSEWAEDVAEDGLSETDRKQMRLAALARYGALGERPLGEAFDAIEGAARDILTRQADFEAEYAERLADYRATKDALISGLKAAKGDGKSKGMFASWLTSAVQFNVPDLFAKMAWEFPEDSDAHRAIDSLRRSISNAHMAEAELSAGMDVDFRSAVERIYGKSFGLAIKELLAPRADLAKFSRRGWYVPEKGVADEAEVEIDGKKVTVRLAVDRSDPRYKGVNDDAEVSVGTLIGIYLAMEQDDMRVNNVVFGKDEAYKEEVRKAIGDKGVAMAEWMRAALEGVREKLSPVAERITGMPVLAPGENYFPHHFVIPDSVQSAERYSISLFPGFLSSRKNHDYATLDETRDAFSSFQNHINQAAHYIAWADVMAKVRATFADKEVRTMYANVLGRKAFQSMYRQLYDTLSGGKRDTSRFGGWLRNFTTTTTLFYNLPLSSKQLEGIGGGWGATMGVWTWFKSLPTLWRGCAEVQDVLKTRGVEGFSEAQRHIKEAIDGVSGRNLWKFYQRNGMILTEKFDALATSSFAGAAYCDRYDWHRKIGKSEEEARQDALADVDYMVQLGQQSSRPEFHNAVQRSGSGGSFLTQFAGPRYIRLGMEIEALHRLWVEKWSAKAFKNLANKVIALHVIGPTLLSMLNALGLTLTHNPDDDEWAKMAYKDWAKACILGPFSGWFIAGSMISSGYDAVTHDYWKRNLGLRKTGRGGGASSPVESKFSYLAQTTAEIAKGVGKCITEEHVKNMDKKALYEATCDFFDALFPAERQVKRTIENVGNWERNVARPVRKASRRVERMWKEGSR